MKFEGECTISATPWGRYLFIQLPIEKSLTADEVKRINNKRAKVSVLVVE